LKHFALILPTLFSTKFLISASNPNVTFVERNLIFPQQVAVFILKSFGFMMFLLVIYVTHKIIDLALPNRKTTVTSLPKE